MSKIIDITDKLNFEENPVIRVKGVDLEVDASAENVLKVMGLASDSPSIQDVEEMCKTVFTEESSLKLRELNLNFDDYSTVVMTAIGVASGTDEEDEELG
ncbi:MAG: hypothetical protein K6G88_05635 [Lachnospiraceae bacterium]|nr:hypothetical protein [Lachnospiraceae bacterium]